jgi:hypothetical protein
MTVCLQFTVLKDERRRRERSKDKKRRGTKQDRMKIERMV